MQGVHDSQYISSLEQHQNVILMGDSLGDISMAQGAHQYSNILKIGFLNDKVRICYTAQLGSIITLSLHYYYSMYFIFQAKIYVQYLGNNYFPLDENI